MSILSITDGNGSSIRFDLDDLDWIIRVQLEDEHRLIRNAQMSAKELIENHPGLKWVLYGGLD